MTLPFNPQDALVATMILTAAADEAMNDREETAVVAIIGLMPVFAGFDRPRFGQISAIVVEMLREEDGIDQILTLVDEALPERLKETAYALACDVAASDGALAQEELRLLEMIRHRLRVGRLPAAAIERGARARFARLE